jgi:hypothetical protein
MTVATNVQAILNILHGWGNLPSQIVTLSGQVAALSNQVAELSNQSATQHAETLAELADLRAEWAEIEVDVNPPPVTLAYAELQKDGTMAVATSINLTAGGTSDQINVEDQNGGALAPATISWSAPIGMAGASDLSDVPSSDGMGFTFTASATAPAESVTMSATWTDPTGVSAPVVGPTLTVNITAAAPVAPTALQYNEVSGA